MTIPRLASDPPPNDADPHDQKTAVGDRSSLLEELRRASAGMPAATRKMDAFDLEAALASEERLAAHRPRDEADEAVMPAASELPAEPVTRAPVAATRAPRGRPSRVVLFLVALVLALAMAAVLAAEWRVLPFAL